MSLGPKIAVCAVFCASLCAFSLSRAQETPEAPGTPRFSYGGDAAVLAAQFTDYLLFLSARVNVSEPSLFELDTTAAATSIAPDRATEIGRMNVPSPMLNFDGVDVPFSVLPALANADFVARVGQEYQGTLGRDFLSNLVLDVDYSRETVRAYAPEHYKYWGKGLAFPITAAGGIPVIPMKFALDKGKEITADFVVDTALNAPVVFDNKFFAARHISSDRGKTLQTVDPFSGMPGAAVGRLRTLALGKYPVDDVLAVFSDHAFPDAGVPVAGAIGSGMLRRFTVVFDNPQHQLILDPNIHFPDPDQEDKSGLLIVAKGTNYKTFEVVGVQPNSPAFDAGIKQGDIIAGIDADPAADLSLLTVRDLFSQVGHKYKVTLERGDKTQEVTIQMRRYF
jgi:hypothetical protein